MRKKSFMARMEKRKIKEDQGEVLSP